MTAAPDSQAVKDAETLADLIITANQKLKQWQAYKDAITARLTNLHDKGLIPTKFEAHGHAFALREGRLNVAFDSIAKERITILKYDLANEGHARTTRGASFWDARLIKTDKGSKAA